MTTFEERLVQAFGGKNLKIIAEKLEINYHTLRNWAKETRDIPPDALRKIAKLTNISLNWLLLGEQNEQAAGISNLRSEISEKLEVIAKEQSRIIHGGADIAASDRAEAVTLRLLTEYLLDEALRSYNVTTESLLSDQDRKRAQKFTFVADRMPSIEEQIRKLVKKESGGTAGLGASDEVRDIIRNIVQEEVGKSRKRRVYDLNVVDESEEETTHRKVG